MKKIWILMFTVFLLLALLATQSQPVTGPLGGTGLIIYQQQQQSASSTASIDLIANVFLVVFILASATLVFTTALFARRLRRSLISLMALGPGI